MLENSVFLDITSKEPEPVEEQVVLVPLQAPEKPKEFPAICPQCLEPDDLRVSECKVITVRKGFWYKKYTFIPHYCRKCDHKYVEGHTEMEKPKFCWSRLWFFLFGIISIACGFGFAYHLYLWITSAASGIPALVRFIGFFANAFVGEMFNNGWQDMTKVKNITGYINPDIEALASLQAESDDWKKWFRKQEVFNYRKESCDKKASEDVDKESKQRGKMMLDELIMDSIYSYTPPIEGTHREHTVYVDGVPFSYHKKQEPTETPDIPTITSHTS